MIDPGFFRKIDPGFFRKIDPGFFRKIFVDVSKCPRIGIFYLPLTVTD